MDVNVSLDWVYPNINYFFKLDLKVPNRHFSFKLDKQPKKNVFQNGDRLSKSDKNGHIGSTGLKVVFSEIWKIWDSVYLFWDDQITHKKQNKRQLLRKKNESICNIGSWSERRNESTKILHSLYSLGMVHPSPFPFPSPYPSFLALSSLVVFNISALSFRRYSPARYIVRFLSSLFSVSWIH